MGPDGFRVSLHPPFLLLLRVSGGSPSPRRRTPAGGPADTWINDPSAYGVHPCCGGAHCGPALSIHRVRAAFSTSPSRRTLQAAMPFLLYIFPETPLVQALSQHSQPSPCLLTPSIAAGRPTPLSGRISRWRESRSVMGPFRVQADAAVFVHVDRPDHAWVVLAGVHEVPDRPARLVLVDHHRSGPTFPARRIAWFCSAAGAPPPVFPRRPRGRPPGRPESWPRRAAFLPFLPGVFRSGGGRRRTPGGAKNSPGLQKTDLCKKSAKGYPATGCRVSARSDLCNERSFRTDVSICTIFRYGPARASVQEKCPAVGEGGTGGVLV